MMTTSSHSKRRELSTSLIAFLDRKTLATRRMNEATLASMSADGREAGAREFERFKEAYENEGDIEALESWRAFLRIRGSL